MANVEVSYLAMCGDCRPVVPVPFSDTIGAESWARQHGPATGHRIRFLMEHRYEDRTEIHTDTPNGHGVLILPAHMTLLDYVSDPQVQSEILKRNNAEWN